MNTINKIFKTAEPLTEMICDKIEKLITDSDTYYIGEMQKFFKRTYLLRQSQDTSEEYVDVTLSKFPKRKFGCYLQRFFIDDTRSEYHNHPWKKSYSLILTNGYIEHRLVNGKMITKTLQPGDISTIRASDFHKLELIDKKRDCLTLFFPGTVIQSWGYWNDLTQTFRLWNYQEVNSQHNPATTPKP